MEVIKQGSPYLAISAFLVMLDMESDENQTGMFNKGNWSLLGKQISPALYSSLFEFKQWTLQSPTNVINDPVSHDTVQYIYFKYKPEFVI